MSSKDERQFQIRQLIQENKIMKMNDLSQYFQVSSETLRKDILDLEKAKIINREYGYIKFLEEPDEMPISLRNQEYIQEKKEIMKKACSYIKEGMMVYLDAGSTCQAGITFLQNIPNITIVTNSIFVAYKCARFNMHIILIGGTIFDSAYRSFGPLACDTMDYIHIDIAILGSKGFLNCNGFTTSKNEYTLKRHVIQQSEKIIVVADQRKFSMSSDFCFCSFKEIDIFITNQYNQEQYHQIQDIPTIIKTEDS